MALLLGWLAWEGWFYLQRGYSLRVSLEDHATSTFHIDFPAWRAIIHILLSAAAIAAILGYVSGHRRASTVAWLTFAATLMVGINDVRQYGMLGSPTSVGTVLLLLLFALLTKFEPLTPKVKA